MEDFNFDQFGFNMEDLFKQRGSGKASDGLRDDFVRSPYHSLNVGIAKCMDLNDEIQRIGNRIKKDTH